MLARFALALALLATPTPTHAEDGCQCGHFEAMLTALEKRHEARISALEKRLSYREPVTEAVGEETGTNAVAPYLRPRRLANGDVHLAVPTLQVHEFPSGHSCSNLNTGTATGLRRILPHTGTAVTFAPSPDWTASATNEMSLASINTDWTTNEIQRIPVPLKVVHDASCSLDPTLELQLNTEMHGTLLMNFPTIHPWGQLSPMDIQAYVGFRFLQCGGTSSATQNKCLEYWSADGNAVVGDCNGQWYLYKTFTWYGKMLRCEADRCLKRQSSDENVVFDYCYNDDGSGNTYWNFDGDTIKHVGATKCLQCGSPSDDASNNVRMETCDGSAFQSWRYKIPGYEGGS